MVDVMLSIFFVKNCHKSFIKIEPILHQVKELYFQYHKVNIFLSSKKYEPQKKKHSILDDVSQLESETDLEYGGFKG